MAERWTTAFGNVLQITLGVLVKSQQLLSKAGFYEIASSGSCLNLQLLHPFTSHLHFGSGEHQVQGKLIRKDPGLNPASYDHQHQWQELLPVCEGAQG